MDPGDREGDAAAPYSRHPRAALILLAIAGAAHGIVALSMPLAPSNDSVFYLAYTHFLSAAGFYDPYGPGVPTAYDIFAAPGYPLLLDVCVALFGWKGLVPSIVLVQHALSIGSTLLIFGMGVRAGSALAGWIAAFAYALYLPASTYCHMIMSETLFITLVLAGAFILQGWLTTRRGASLWSAGLLFGAAALVRPNGALCAAIAPLALLGGKDAWSDKLLRTMRLLLPVAALLLAGIVHNQIWFGRAELAGGSARHLANRIWGFQRHLDRTDSATREIIRLCRQSGMIFAIPSNWHEYMRALRRGGDLSADAADAMLMKMTVAAIRRDPLDYLAATPRAIRYLMVEPDRWMMDLGWYLRGGSYRLHLSWWTRDPAPEDRSYIPPVEMAGRRDLVHRLGLGSVPAAAAVLEPILVAWDSSWPHYDGTWAWPLGLAILIAAASRGWERRILGLCPVVLVLPVLLAEFPFPRYRQPAVPFALLSLSLAGVAASGWAIPHLRARLARAVP